LAQRPWIYPLFFSRWWWIDALGRCGKQKFHLRTFYPLLATMLVLVQANVDNAPIPMGVLYQLNLAAFSINPNLYNVFWMGI
jgi:hypothetical protein